MGRLRGTAAKLLLLALGAALGIAGAELVLRGFIGPVPRQRFTPISSSIRMPSGVPDMPYVLRPGAEVVHVFPDDPRGYFDAGATLTYRINSLGFRGRETTREKPAAVFRILGLGDSFTFGTGVRVEDTFLARLEQQLNAGGGSRLYEVLNLGVMGYDTAQEVALLRRVGLGLHPDLVLICFFLNDTEGGATFSLFNPGPTPGRLESLRRSSWILDRVLWGLERRRSIEELEQVTLRSFEPHASGWIGAQRALEQAGELARSEGFELALVIFPVLWELSDEHPFAEIHEQVRDFADGLGIRVLDLLPEFAGFRGPELWVHPTNQHPNERAHAIAARALFSFLRDAAPAPEGD